MTEYLKRTWRRMPSALRVCVIGAFATVTALGLSLFVAAAPASETAADPSADEIAFGLDPADPMQREIDLDRDGLTLMAEIEAGTDPVVADTDQDGVPDGQDGDPLSRAVIYWGDPDLTEGDTYSYRGPAWFRGAARMGGEWIAEGGWLSSHKKRAENGLILQLGRQSLSRDLVLDLMAWGEEGASLTVMLMDAEGRTVVNDVFGNLLTEPENVLKCRRTLPLARLAHAAGVYLRCTGGQVAVYWSTLYIDEDRDGLDAQLELQLGTSDLSPNGRLGAVNDWTTQIQYPPSETSDVLVSSPSTLAAFSPSPGGGGMAMMMSAETDTDADGMPDQWETQYGLNPSSGLYQGLAAWWPFDHGSGTELEDYSGNDYDGDLIDFGTNCWVTGKLGYALEFDGIDDYVEVAQSNAIINASDTEFTLSGWLWLDASCTSQYLTALSDMSWDSTNRYMGYWLGFDRDPLPDEMWLFWGGPGIPAGTVGSTAQSEYTNRWAHVAATCDGTNKIFYLNGEEIESESSPAFGAAEMDEVLIGTDVWDYFWAGKIDDLRIYDVALASNQVATLYDAFNDDDGDGLENLEEYQAGSYPNDADSDDDGYPDATEVLYSTCPTNASDYPAMTSGLVAWWKMDEGSGSAAADSTTNENDATLYNGATWNSTLGQPGLVLGAQTNTYAGTAGGISTPRLDRYTLSMWVNPDFASGAYTYMGVNMSSSNYKWRLWSRAIRGTTTTQFPVYLDMGRSNTWISSGSHSIYSATNEIWTHLAVTYDGQAMRYYHDGELNRSNAYENFHIEASDLKTYLANNMSNLTTYAWEGGMHDVRLYDWALGSNAVADVLSDDVDGDGLGTVEEHANGCDPYKEDTDGDGMPDGWEVENGLDPVSSGSPGLMAWWKFDEGSGSSVSNSAADAFHGSTVGMSAMNWVEGKLGTALSFDGADDAVEVSQTSGAVVTGDEFTVSAWVWLDGSDLSTYMSVVSDMDSSFNGYWLGLDEENPTAKLALCFSDSSSGYGKLGETDYSLFTNQWVHIAGTCDGSNKSFYLDGEEIDSDTTPGFEAVEEDTLYIGWDNWDDAWVGMIDDVRIYESGLTSNEVASIYNASSPDDYGPDGDPDGDGYTNYEEYQLGRNPKAGVDESAEGDVELEVYTPSGI